MYIVPQIVEHRIVNLSNSTFGRVYHLNYPEEMPESIDYTQHLIAPSGDVISIELRGLQFSENGCNDSATIEVCINTFSWNIFLLLQIFSCVSLSLSVSVSMNEIKIDLR